MEPHVFSLRRPRRPSRKNFTPPPSQKFDQGDAGDFLGLLRLFGQLFIDQGENQFLLGRHGVLSC